MHYPSSKTFRMTTYNNDRASSVTKGKWRSTQDRIRKLNGMAFISDLPTQCRFPRNLLPLLLTNCPWNRSKRKKRDPDPLRKTRTAESERAHSLKSTLVAFSISKRVLPFPYIAIAYLFIYVCSFLSFLLTPAFSMYPGGMPGLKGNQ